MHKGLTYTREGSDDTRRSQRSADTRTHNSQLPLPMRASPSQSASAQEQNMMQMLIRRHAGSTCQATYPQHTERACANACTRWLPERQTHTLSHTHLPQVAERILGGQLASRGLRGWGLGGTRGCCSALPTSAYVLSSPLHFLAAVLPLLALAPPLCGSGPTDVRWRARAAVACAKKLTHAAARKPACSSLGYTGRKTAVLGQGVEPVFVYA